MMEPLTVSTRPSNCVNHSDLHLSPPPSPSRNSCDTKSSHQEYLDGLVTPSKETIQKIAVMQEHKEEEGAIKRESEDRKNESLGDQERLRAAGLIQRSYRGHRERRMLNGHSLDPNTRWVEAIKEARYRNLTQPRPRNSIDDNSRASIDTMESSQTNRRGSVAAKQNWKKIALIARRAGGDEDEDDQTTSGEEDMPEKEREARRKMHAQEKNNRRDNAKMMDLQYFLEMVDLKHRYGSNLRTYHEQWKKSDTNENFFYWLDYGEGKNLDCQGCPRDRLDREQVRYLSKEERLQYLVRIDGEGRLCWAKNGDRIDTTEKFKDSIHGIVADTDDTPAYAPRKAEAKTHDTSDSSASSDSSDDDEDDEAARADKYATPGFDNSKGVKKVKHVSAATIFNKLLRKSVKRNTWIFVADTSFRLYVGIKQSGAFQHSSFLHGSRISAAGLIKIKNGRISKLSPLSGHYRPPVSNFRSFIHSLKDGGADMTHVSISRSYAVLVGLEAYVKTRRRGKKAIRKLTHGRDKLLSPDEVAKKEEEERDKSQSAERERLYLEKKQHAEAEKREHHRSSLHLFDKLGISGKGGKNEEEVKEQSTPAIHKAEAEKEVEIQAPGTGPENYIAPDGSRNLEKKV